MASTGLLKITIPPVQLERARALLSAKQFKQAAFQAVKRTTHAGVKMAIDLLQETTTIKQKYAARAIKERLDHGDVPVGEIVISSKPVPLVGFKFSASKRGGVTVQYSKNGSPITFRHAFKATVASGQQEDQDVSHTGVFVRARGGQYSQRGSFPVTPRGIAWRLPIKQLRGPRVIDLIDVEATRNELLSRLGDRLMKEWNSQLSRFLDAPSGRAAA